MGRRGLGDSMSHNVVVALVSSSISFIFCDSQTSSLVVMASGVIRINCICQLGPLENPSPLDASQVRLVLAARCLRT